MFIETVGYISINSVLSIHIIVMHAVRLSLNRGCAFFALKHMSDRLECFKRMRERYLGKRSPDN